MTVGLDWVLSEWVGTAILAAIPYLVIGVIWSLTHTDHLHGMTGIDRTVSIFP